MSFCQRCGTERGHIYRPRPRSGDVVAVAFERRGLEYVFDHIYGIDAHSRGVPKKAIMFVDEKLKGDVLTGYMAVAFSF